MEIYRNKELPAKTRAADLLSKMTLDEKLMQMNLYCINDSAYEKLLSENNLELRGGMFANSDTKDNINEIQEYFLNRTRLGIPVLVAYEAIRGLIDKRATVFPQCAGLGGSFNREAIFKMADIIGSEAAALGIRQVYAPDIDIPRDPRWGRMQETYGEDPYMSGEMGAAYVKGVQKHNVAATLKHFTAYGVPENGINLAPAHMGEREMREITLEPFKKCIDAGAMSVMPAYNEIDGEPVHASKKLLRKVLREELGFDGMMVSDYGGIEMLHTFHCIAKDKLTAGKRALEAGVDMEAPEPFGYGEEMKKAVINGEIDENLIDEAVLNILTLKFKLGLFENPYADSEKIKCMHSDEAVQLARELDEQSILLLKNDGILPLSEKTVGKAAVIGSNAKESFLGDYIDRTENCVSFYDGIVNSLGKENVLYARGCNPVTKNKALLEEAIETASAADIVFLVLGDTSAKGGGIAGEPDFNMEVTCGEGYDTHDLNFPPSQQELFDEIIKLGKPVILILYAGRPYTLEKEVEKVNGFMFSWGGGEQSGNAFANLIFGAVSPSAKLSVSFPKTAGHLPCYYNHKVSARGRYYKSPGSEEKTGRDYVLSSPKAWYPFGYGLSYTSLKYSSLNAEHTANGTVKVSVSVENTGHFNINESVLLYLSAEYCPVTPFVRRLRGFEKVYLKPCEQKTVTFILADEDFSYIDYDYNTKKLNGKYKILIEDLECEIEV